MIESKLACLGRGRFKYAVVPWYTVESLGLTQNALQCVKEHQVLVQVSSSSLWGQCWPDAMVLFEGCPVQRPRHPSWKSRLWESPRQRGGWREVDSPRRRPSSRERPWTARNPSLSSSIPLMAGPSITSNFTFIGDFWVERHTLAECTLEYTPCYEKSILGSKQPVSGIFLVAHITRQD